MNLFAALALASLCAAPIPKTDPVKGDQEVLQGEWKVVEYFKAGINRSEEQTEAKLIFKGDALTIHEQNGNELLSTFTLDPKASPKTIDIKVAGQKEMVVKGIYKIEKEKVTICFGFGGKDRPKEFKPDGNSDIGQFTLERVKK